MAEEISPLKRPGQVQSADPDDTLLAQGLRAGTGDVYLRDTANGLWTLTAILAAGGGGITPEEEQAILLGYSSGVLSGMGVAINAGDPTQFDVSDGTVNVVDTYTSPSLPTIDQVDFAGLTAVARTTGGQSPQATLTFLGLNAAGSVVQFSEADISTEDFRDHAFFGVLWHPEGDGNVIVLTAPFGQVGQGATDALYSFRRIFGTLRQAGLVYSANGANQSLNRSAGTLNQLGGAGYITIAARKNTNENDLTALTLVSIRRAYRNATNGLTITGPSTVWDPGVWDDGSGTLQAFPGPDNYGIARAYLGPGGATVIGVPQATYRTQADAFNAIFAPIEERSFLAASVLSTWCVFRKNATVFTDPNEATFFAIPTLFRLSGGGTATVSGAQAVTRIATTVVTSPHAARDPAAAVVLLDTPGTANQLTAIFPANTEGSSGSFSFRVKVGPQGGSLTTVGDVSVTQGTAQAVVAIPSPVAFAAGNIMQVEELAVGDFPGGASNIDKRCAVSMRFTET